MARMAHPVLVATMGLPVTHLSGKIAKYRMGDLGPWLTQISSAAAGAGVVAC